MDSVLNMNWLTQKKKFSPFRREFCMQNQPFRPPRATPRTMYLRANRNRITTGKTTTEEAAISNSGYEPASVVKTCKPHGSVRFSLLTMTYIGHMNEFQLAKPLSRMIVISDGRAIGTMTFHKKRQLLDPSIRADQYRLSEIESKKFFKIYV